MIILQILAFLIMLCVIISLHELGHFLFAKKAGILCHEYSIGMGPLIHGKRKGETLYSIRAIPLGGYVSMAGEETGMFFKKGDTIGLNLDDSQMVREIVIEPEKNQDISSDITGKVIDFDLYDEKNTGKLFIILESNGEQKEYLVLENAMYQFKKGQPTQVTPYKRCFESKTLWQRFITIFMGPAMNFILAFLIFFIVAAATGAADVSSTRIGTVSTGYGNEEVLKKNDRILSLKSEDMTDFIEVSTWTEFQEAMDTLEGYQKLILNIERDSSTLEVSVKVVQVYNSIGISSDTSVEDKVIIGSVFGRSEAAGAKAGMEIKSVEISGVKTDITSWKDLSLLLKNQKSTKVKLNCVKENGEDFSYTVRSFDKVISMQGAKKVSNIIGISPKYKFSFSNLFVYPFKAMWSNIKQVYQTLGLLITASEGVSIKDLSGPIGIFSMTGNYMKGGFWSLLYFAGFLSVNIGFMNLLPIFALDGGRLVFLLYELITRRKVSKKVENTLITITYILLMVLFVYVCFNDIVRIIK